MKFLIRLFVNALALLLVAYLFPAITVSSLYIAVISAIILGIVNALIRPIILFITLPINILTLGLFTLVINALLFWFVATFIEGFEVAGFWPAFSGALTLTIISWLTNKFIKTTTKYK